MYSAGLKSTLTNASARVDHRLDGHPAIGLGLVTGQSGDVALHSRGGAPMRPGRSHLPDRETGGQQAPIARVRGIGLGDPLAHGGRPDDATNSGRISSPHIVPKSLALAMRMRRTDL